MKKLVWVLVAVLTIIFTPNNFVRANQNLHGLLIAEVQTGSTSSASEEFIELYNPDDISVNLSTYVVEYFPATATDFSTPSRTIALSGVLASGGRYLLASTNYLTQDANTSFGATLAKTGGHLRIVKDTNEDEVIEDLVGWGSAQLAETAAAPAVNGGESLQRKINEESERLIDTNNNFDDFLISTSPSPESIRVSAAPTEPEEPEVPEEPEDPEVPTEPEQPIQEPEIPEPEAPTIPENPEVLPLHITELLPNPGSPKTDTNDEFIELFNPNSEPIDLEGYMLQTGNDFSYSYTFGARVIGAQQYLVLTSLETNLTLANGGGKARLIHADGTVLSETMSYDEAKDDMAWARVGSAWQWTTSATPGQANLITAELKDNSVLTKLKKAAAPKVKAPKTSSAKTASTKATKAAATKAGAKVDEDSQEQQDKRKLPMQPVILAGVGTLALAYAAYEYRSDIANQFRKLRGFRKDSSNSGE